MRHHLFVSKYEKIDICAMWDYSKWKSFNRLHKIISVDFTGHIYSTVVFLKSNFPACYAMWTEPHFQEFGICSLHTDIRKITFTEFGFKYVIIFLSWIYSRYPKAMEHAFWFTYIHYYHTRYRIIWLLWFDSSINEYYSQQMYRAAVSRLIRMPHESEQVRTCHCLYLRRVSLLFLPFQENSISSNPSSSSSPC